jgi:cell pole-organizing protein PopZ
MGDVSAEPSMEDILSSIKRIIAEEGDERPARPRRTGNVRAVPMHAIDDEDETEEVLELSDPMPPSQPRAVPSPPTPEVQLKAAPATPEPESAHRPEPTIMSEQTAQATRGALDSLSRLLVKPESPSDGTLEGLVREMLRPMLRDWLDANLPAMVETLVAREITKITRGS